MHKPIKAQTSAFRFRSGTAALEGDLAMPEGANGMVLFAHGSGSSRHSPRNRYVAQMLQDGGLGTLLIDLLTSAEEEEERWSRRHRFNIRLLADRLIAATDAVRQKFSADELQLGYFGASTGAAAALVAAAERPEAVAAIVSRGGRPDLAHDALRQVQAPTLLIVGGDDIPVIRMNEEAFEQLIRTADKHIVIVPGASHLFEEPGTLEEVGRLACEWFGRYLVPVASQGPGQMIV